MTNKPIQDFPSLSEVENEVEKQSTEQEKAQAASRRPWTRYPTIALVILALGLAVFQLLPRAAAAPAAGTGGLSGQVVNQSLTPIPAEVYILQTENVTTADPAGAFTLNGVPEGPQELMVSYGGVGYSTRVTIERGKTFNVGQIRVQETMLPPEQ